jgi:uncharacterized protein involved in outer membrane biogenesis
MKKVVLGVILILIIALGLGIYYLLTNLDGIVKAAIEKYGSEATQTKVRVSSVRISLQEGAASIKGTTVANPRGFDGPYAFSLGEIEAKINIGSLTGEVIVIDDIIFRAPQIFVEINVDRKTNLDVLKKNITSSASTTPTSKQANQQKEKELKLIIRRVLFADGNILAKVVPLNGKEYQLKLPTIVMKNLGEKTGGTPEQIASQALSELTNRALAEVKKKGIDRGTEKIKAKAKEKLEAEKRKTKDKLKRLLRK